MSKNKNQTQDMSWEDLRKELDNFDAKDLHEQTTDIVGYWNHDYSPILCIPRSAKIFDGNIKNQENRPAILLFVELVARCGVDIPKSEERAIANPGDMVGVWYKAGMRAIRDLGGVTVRMEMTGTKDTGQPTPMFMYSIKSSAKGRRIPVTEDNRKVSAHVETIFDVKEAEKKAQNLNKTAPTAPNVGSDPNDRPEEDDIPF